jgi:hypothetical protein
MTEVEALRTKIKMLENDLVMTNSILESIEDILNGKEPSDFMLSFGIVRDVFDLKWQSDGLTRTERSIK